MAGRKQGVGSLVGRVVRAVFVRDDYEKPKSGKKKKPKKRGAKRHG